MLYRLIKISSYYRDFLDDYYRKNPKIINLSYTEQFNHLMSQGYGYADWFSRHLRSLGNECFDIIRNAYPLQTAWSRENGFSKTGYQLIIKQLETLRPDVVLFQDSMYYGDYFFKTIREKIPSIKLLIQTYGSPVTESYLQSFKSFDIILAHSPVFKEIAERYTKSYLFYHCIEKSLYEGKTQQKNDVVFIGSLNNSPSFHQNRTEFFTKILKVKANTKIILNTKPEYLHSLVIRFVIFQCIQILKALGLSPLLLKIPIIKKFVLLDKLFKPAQFPKGIIKKSLYGIEMIAQLKRAKIGVNIHGGVAGDYAANVRMFEVTGAGACLFTDDKKNIRDLFIPGEEIITYKSTDECIYKLRWLLNHPHERAAIARNGRARTLRDHTVQNRAQFLDQIIKANI